MQKDHIAEALRELGQNEIDRRSPDIIDVPGAFDGHYHTRDDDRMELAMEHVVKRWCGATFMTNFSHPVTTLARAREFNRRIKQHIPGDFPFYPITTLYLTDTTDPRMVEKGFKEGLWGASKLYLCTPDKKGGTTGAENGVTDIENVFPVYERQEKIGMPALMHGEVVDEGTDEFDREVMFVDLHLRRTNGHFPELKWVMEHISTTEAVQFIEESRNGRGTITIHHAMLNRNALYRGGLQPQHWCRPILKRERHRLAVLQAMLSDNGKFGAGTDAALHWDGAKFKPCGAAGIYTGHLGIEGYAQMFDEAGLLKDAKGIKRFKRFVSEVIPRHYGLPTIKGVVRLERKPWVVPGKYYSVLGEPNGRKVTPLLAGKTIQWSARRVE